jgi:hypothetical protein
MKHANLLGLALALLIVCGCAELPEPTMPGNVCEAVETYVEAQEQLQSVLAFVEDAKGKVEATQGLLEAADAAKEAFDSERYSDAVAEAAHALKLLEELGAKIPSEIPKRLGQAEVLLAMAGK